MMEIKEMNVKVIKNAILVMEMEKVVMEWVMMVAEMTDKEMMVVWWAIKEVISEEWMNLEVVEGI